MTSRDLDSRLCQALCEHPRLFDNKFTDAARHSLLEILFRSLTNDRQDYLSEIFPNGFQSYSLQEAQGPLEEREYTEAARGFPCGHILKSGEPRYRCSTCTNDPTAVLCSKCFAASDHEDHQVEIAISNGNGGCCDCGDDEAWKIPVRCAIHSNLEQIAGYVHVEPNIPDDLRDAVHTTVGRCLDYFCDVISCSPENLRTPKTVESVQQDEANGRLDKSVYVTGDEVETNPEYNLIMWNDEKHTMDEVQEQTARACRERRRFGLAKAEEANDVGRSIVCQSRNLQEMLRRAKIIEEIKITVTVRSARDTFREQMCGTILDWLSDIAGCVLKGNASFLRQAICEEFLQIWRVGSQACNARIGREGTEDHGLEDLIEPFPDRIQMLLQQTLQLQAVGGDAGMEEDTNDGDLTDADDDEDDDEDEDYEQIDSQMAESIVSPGYSGPARNPTDIISDVDEMDTDGDTDFLDANERMDADDTIPPPPPPPPPPGPLDAEPTIALTTDDLSRHTSASLVAGENSNYRNVPRTPGNVANRGPRQTSAESTHWRALSQSKGKSVENQTPVWEDIRKNIRLDSMILFDLRLWKKLRITLRELLISTVIKVPQFKRILGLRFAGLYTTLAQLYLVADREPDHSILHLSVQILTTPSIAEEVIQKGNFLTNLMAILYTFLTTRQVGYPEEVDPNATLGFDAGSVANRRLYSFFHDLGYFLAAPAIKERVRLERQYLLQYLDLAKLSQGICPNIRAIGEHVEYETDAWISASLLTREINKLCRQVTEGFRGTTTIQGIDEHLSDAIRQTTITTLLICSGLDRLEQSEVKELIKFHAISPFPSDSRLFKTVHFVVEKGTLSFHHPLHYTLSWLLENGKDTHQTIVALQDAASELVSRFNASAQANLRFPLHTLYETGEDALLGLFDYPLRVCAWLAQMRANMWVRNGMSLRHQMSQYKSVIHRDVGHHRDLFLLQTALVACSPERVLAAAIDRFGLVPWVSGRLESESDAEQSQLTDIAEDFVYLFINLLSDRDSLSFPTDDVDSQVSLLRKDIAHTLCFKPLSFTDLTNKLTERAQDHDKLQAVLESITTFKAPEGLHDTGTFELKPEYLQELDPYNSHFSKNQRDEAENIYKIWMARKLNKQPEDIVLEPKLNPIRCLAYKDLCAVIHTPLFTHMLFSMLEHMVNRPASISATRAESFLHNALHLTLIATMEDHSVEEDATRTQSLFIKNALTQAVGAKGETIVASLQKIWLAEEYASCMSKVKHILRLFNRQWPLVFTESTKDLHFPATRFDSASPATLDIDMEAKKKQAMERKARVMAQMQQQQQSFMNNQGMTDWGDDLMNDAEVDVPESTELRIWKFPAGVCIQCREEMDNTKFFGTFAMVSDAHLLRTTPSDDPVFVQELFISPENLDESNEDARPFGVAGQNVEYLKRYSSDGTESITARRGISKGWPKEQTLKEPLSTSCGHLMHFSCFENYYESVRKRHTIQISRRHPERLSQNEFVCPLCKALANTFLPILYRQSEQSFPGALQSESNYEMFLEETLPAARKTYEVLKKEDRLSDHLSQVEKQLYADTVLAFTTNAITPLVHSMAEIGGVPDLTQSPAIDALVELSKIYTRLRGTFEIANNATAKASSSTKQVVKTMYKVLTNSIAAVEIANRGRVSVGICFGDGIASQTLAHLQVMGHSVHAYSAAMVMVDQSEGPDLPYQSFVQDMSARLFGGTLSDGSVESILEVDGFASFVELSVIYARIQGLPIVHLLRICLTQELVRVAIWWSCIRRPTNHEVGFGEQQGQSSQSTPLSKEEHIAVSGFSSWLTSTLSRSGSMSFRPIYDHGALLKALRAYSLAFMRKVVLLLHTAHGVDFPAVPSLTNKHELERLLGLCKLPELTSVLSSFSEYTVETALPSLVRGWIQVWTQQNESRRSTSIKLLHPAPFELIGLPQYYDILIEECQKRKCPTTGKDLTDPALCLFCGDIFCSQSFCCMTDKLRGGCNHHIETCSSPIGIYLFIRKCNIVLLDVRKDPRKLDRFRDGQEGISLADITSSHGSWFSAPYLTKHGETDQGLRTKHQLILNQKRYDKLVRDVWLMLNGSIWSAIARKLEADNNAGGWETL